MLIEVLVTLRPLALCMKQKAVDEHGGSIICLPNKVVIEGENTTEDSDSKSSPKIDAVT